MKHIKEFRNYKHDVKGLIPGGEADGMKTKDIAKKHHVTYNDIAKELEIGKIVQREHTKKDKTKVGDEDTNKEIAMDHLAENPKYYTDLVEAGIVDEIEAIKMYIDIYGSIESEETLKKYKDKFGQL